MNITPSEMSKLMFELANGPLKAPMAFGVIETGMSCKLFV